MKQALSIIVILFLISSFSPPLNSSIKIKNKSSENFFPPDPVTSRLKWLYVSKHDFVQYIKANQSLIMFRFTFTSNNITLTGWVPKNGNDNNDDYDNNTIQLSATSVPGTVTGDTLYFGNTILNRNNIGNILLALIDNNTAKYILFKPVNDATSPKNIVYEIYLSTNDNPSGIIEIQKFPLVTKVTAADPSPPATRK